MLNAFRKGLQESGYIEGSNVAIEYRWAEGRNDRLPAMAADLVRRQVTVIVAMDTAGTRGTGNNHYESNRLLHWRQPGATWSVHQPQPTGGNLTGGVTLSVELAAKRLQLLHELVPAANIIALLVNPTIRKQDYIEEPAKGASDLELEVQVLLADQTRDR